MKIRLTLFLAARVLSRARGRNALITAMIALPVVAMVAFATVFASTQATPRESLGYELGRTQAWVEMEGSGPFKQLPTDPTIGVATGRVDDQKAQPKEPGPYLPRGADTVRIDTTTVTAQTATGVASIFVTVGRSWDPVLDGRYRFVSGRTPVSSDEAMVTASALKRMGITVGEKATITRPVTRQYTIVGVMSDAQAQSGLEELFVGWDPTGTIATDDAAGYSFPRWYVVGSSLTWPDVQKLNAVGGVALSRSVVLDPPPVDADVAAAAVDRNMGHVWQSIAVLIVGVFALLQIALLAAAAFMVGARQQERTLAILASVGADRRLIRIVVSLGGLLLGTLGAAIGVALGVPLGWLIITLTRDGSASQYPGFHVDPLITGGIVAIAIAFSWIASSIPARSASRIDVVAALRGASRPATPRRRTPIVGVVFVLLGAALCVTGGVLFGVFSRSSNPLQVTLMVGAAILGPIAILVGVIFIGPTILRAVSRILSIGGVGARLASRDAARNSARTVPAIAAVISTVFVAAFGACLTASLQTTSAQGYRYNSAMSEVSVSLLNDDDWKNVSLDAPAPLAQAISSSFDVSTVRVVTTAAPDKSVGDAKTGGLVAEPVEQVANLCPWDPRLPNPTAFAPSDSDAAAPCQTQPDIMGTYGGGGYSTQIVVGNADILQLVLGEKPTAAARAALSAGKAVSLYDQYISGSGRVSIGWWPSTGDRGEDGTKPAKTATVAAVTQKPAHELPFGIVISPATAKRLGIVTAPTLVVAALSSPATTAQRDAATAAVQAATGSEYRTVHVETGPDDFVTPVTLILLLVSTVISLAAAIAAIGLARSDGRRDDAILGAVGAPPLLRRSFGFWQAVIIAGVGSVLGVLLGVAEFVSLTIPKLTGSATGGLDPAAPILPLVVIAVGIPAVIAVGAWLGTRRGRTSVLDRSVIA